MMGPNLASKWTGPTQTSPFRPTNQAPYLPELRADWEQPDRQPVSLPLLPSAPSQFFKPSETNTRCGQTDVRLLVSHLLTPDHRRAALKTLV